MFRIRILITGTNTASGQHGGKRRARYAVNLKGVFIMACCGRFDNKTSCELLCKHLQKIAENSTDKDFYKIYSAIDELLNYEGLLDAVFSANIGNIDMFIDNVKKQ